MVQRHFKIVPPNTRVKTCDVRILNDKVINLALSLRQLIHSGHYLGVIFFFGNITGNFYTDYFFGQFSYEIYHDLWSTFIIYSKK
jgi:hypothetical protein